MQIKYNKIALSLLLAAMSVPMLAAGATRLPSRYAGTLLTPTAGDLVPTHLLAVERSHVALDHAPVAVSWSLPANKQLKAAPQPYRSVSRQYLIDANGAELQRGVDIPLTAKGDVVRISPLSAGAAAVDPARVQLATHGQRLDAAQASQVVASGQQVRRAGMPIQRGSTVIRLNDRVKPGSTRIAAQGAHGQYLIQVYEPASPFALSLAANHGTRLAGQAVQFKVAFAKPAAHTMMLASLNQVTGVLVAPDGWSENVGFARGSHGAYVATVSLPAAHAGERGLWEIHAFAHGHAGSQTVLREATSAFAVVLPTARFSGGVTQLAAHAGQNLDVDVGIDVAAPSRYAVSAVLYGHAANGRLQPAVYAQSAAWLQPGRNVPIRLSFSATAIAKSGLAGPFQLRHLRLDDQQQLGVLERRALAVRGLVYGGRNLPITPRLH